MRSTKLFLLMLSLSLVLVLPATMAAQNGQTAIPGGITFYNACDSSQPNVIANGYTNVNYQQNGTQATVHVLFHNATTDGSYQLNLEANQSYNAVASTYDVPFHSVWAGPGGTFTMDGTLRISVDANGMPTSSNILMDADHPLTATCSQ